MEHSKKVLLKNISPKAVRELLKEHLSKISRDKKSKEVTLTIDKKYSFNSLNSSDSIKRIIIWIKNTFGEDYKTVLKLSSHLMKGENTEHHDREMNTPYKVHYR